MWTWYSPDHSVHPVAFWQAFSWSPNQLKCWLIRKTNFLSLFTKVLRFLQNASLSFTFYLDKDISFQSEAIVKKSSSNSLSWSSDTRCFQFFSKSASVLEYIATVSPWIKPLFTVMFCMVLKRIYTMQFISLKCYFNE